MRTHPFPPPVMQQQSATQEAFPPEKIIAREAAFFRPGTGVDVDSGMPFDHVRIRLKSGKLAEVGSYTAASKISLLIPYLLGVIQQKPGFTSAEFSAPQARASLKKLLTGIQRFGADYPAYHHFVPWVEIRKDGTITPSGNKIPSLDNGQMTWALAAVAGALQNSSEPEDQELVSMAERFLAHQNYSWFYNREAGLLYGTVQLHPTTKKWTGDESYYLNDMFEGTMAVLWAVLHNQAPEAAWTNLAIPTVEYTTRSGEKITTLQGHRASFHEHWALGYLPLMKSKLAPLYTNYLHVQADYAHINRLPGFLATAYDSEGAYRQMGVPNIAAYSVDRSNIAVTHATAMAMLIDSEVGQRWLENIYRFPGIQTPYGALESAGPDGFADIFTADGKGLTILGASGGVRPEIEAYLRSRRVPGQKITLYDRLVTLLDSKYEQMLTFRGKRPLFMAKKSCPLPNANKFVVELKELPRIGPEFNVSANLQPGHLHGKGVRSVGLPTLEDDIRPGEPFSFEFDISEKLLQDDQWAFRGTYLSEAVRIAEMKYLTVSVPVESAPYRFDVELKRDDTRLATVRIDTTEKGVLSADGKWKSITVDVAVIPEAKFLPLNYVSIAFHDPQFLRDQFASTARHGTIQIKDLRLTEAHPFTEKPAGQDARVVPVVEGDSEIIQYWNSSQGWMEYKKDAVRKIVRFYVTRAHAWSGGYVPYTDISAYKFVNVKIRNLSSDANRVKLELKNEDTYLLGGKSVIHLPADDKWYVVQLPIPPGVVQPLNYFAVSDPLGSFELGSVAFSNEPLNTEEAKSKEVKCTENTSTVPLSVEK